MNRSLIAAVLNYILPIVIYFLILLTKYLFTFIYYDTLKIPTFYNPDPLYALIFRKFLKVHQSTPIRSIFILTLFCISHDGHASHVNN